MNGSSRVSNITSSSSVKSSDSRDSSRGQASDVHRGRGRDTGISSSMVSQASISKTGVSETSETQTSISQSVSSSIEGISLSLPLGDMDGSSRVSNITSSSSIGASDSRDGSRGQASDVQRARGRNVRVSSSNMVSKTGVSETSVSQSSVSESGVSKTVSSSVVGISISLSLPLGDMNGSSRVSDITSSSSIKSSDSRDSSRGQASDVHR